MPIVIAQTSERSEPLASQCQWEPEAACRKNNGDADIELRLVSPALPVSEECGCSHAGGLSSLAGRLRS